MTDVNTTAGAVGWENAPDHYKGNGGIENFDVWDEYEMDPYTANAFKYLARWDKKGSPLNDLKKALHYVEELILRWDDGRLRWGPVVVNDLRADKVAEAFGLSGEVAAAVRFLLNARSSTNPLYTEAALLASKEWIKRAIKEFRGES